MSPSDILQAIMREKDNSMNNSSSSIDIGSQRRKISPRPLSPLHHGLNSDSSAVSRSSSKHSETTTEEPHQSNEQPRKTRSFAGLPHSPSPEAPVTSELPEHGAPPTDHERNESNQEFTSMSLESLGYDTGEEEIDLKSLSDENLDFKGSEKMRLAPRRSRTLPLDTGGPKNPSRRSTRSENDAATNQADDETNLSMESRWSAERPPMRSRGSVPSLIGAGPASKSIEWDKNQVRRHRQAQSLIDINAGAMRAEPRSSSSQNDRWGSSFKLRTSGSMQGFMSPGMSKPQLAKPLVSPMAMSHASRGNVPFKSLLGPGQGIASSPANASGKVASIFSQKLTPEQAAKLLELQKLTVSKTSQGTKRNLVPQLASPGLASPAASMPRNTLVEMMRQRASTGLPAHAKVQSTNSLRDMMISKDRNKLGHPATIDYANASNWKAAARTDEDAAEEFELRLKEAPIGRQQLDAMKALLMADGKDDTSIKRRGSRKQSLRSVQSLSGFGDDESKFRRELSSTSTNSRWAANSSVSSVTSQRTPSVRWDVGERKVLESPQTFDAGLMRRSLSVSAAESQRRMHASQVSPIGLAMAVLIQGQGTKRTSVRMARKESGSSLCSNLDDSARSSLRRSRLSLSSMKQDYHEEDAARSSASLMANETFSPISMATNQKWPRSSSVALQCPVPPFASVLSTDPISHVPERRRSNPQNMFANIVDRPDHF